jgi:hypothetical protein
MPGCRAPARPNEPCSSASRISSGPTGSRKLASVASSSFPAGGAVSPAFPSCQGRPKAWFVTCWSVAHDVSDDRQWSKDAQRSRTEADYLCADGSRMRLKRTARQAGRAGPGPNYSERAIWAVFAARTGLNVTLRAGHRPRTGHPEPQTSNCARSRPTIRARAPIA